MKKIYAFTILCFAFFPALLTGQSTARQVYNIFQANCNNSGCHNNIDQAAGLDLEGAGATLNDRLQAVYAGLFDVAPVNSHAVSKGYKLVYPGDPYRSSLFRRVHNNLDPSMELDSLEGASKTGLADTEIELIRQWILYGSPTSGAVVDSSLLADFYAGNAVYSIDTIPDAPAPGTGFQVHLGPSFLEPNGEDEFFYKYRTETPNGVEVTDIAPIFGPWSHHFILNQFDTNQGNGYSWGLRDASSHFDARLMGVFQFADTLSLPGGTAFEWPINTELDFNSHFINYSFTDVLACDVYLNVYTQPVGTAAQIMQAEMVPNFAIFIPADTTLYTFELPWFNPLDQSVRHVWSITSHTHKYGKEFKVFSRNSDGSKDDLLYDADYRNGNPNDILLGYDYQHPPQRFFSPFVPIQVNKGLIQRAQYLNDGPQSVQWGNTSDDEMMLLIYYYLNDTAGVILDRSGETIAQDIRVKVWPNPTTGMVHMGLRNLEQGEYSIEIMDLQGRILRKDAFGTHSPNSTRYKAFDLGNENAGIYFYRITGENGWSRTGKIILNP